MSASIIPDMYRYTARKSTVSKNPKSQTMPLCNGSISHQSACRHDTNLKTQQAKLSKIDEQHNKLEKDTKLPYQSFLIIPDNEIEQMIVDEDNEQSISKDVLNQIVEELSNDGVRSLSLVSPPVSNQIRKTSLDTQGAHSAMDSAVNHLNENDDLKSSSGTIDKRIQENVNRNSEQLVSMGSNHSETQAISITDNSHACICQCHTTNSPMNDDFLLFEQALKQARIEQQQERSLNNNPLIQTLKRQHDELINIYQQSKCQKQSNSNRTDREQQTTKLHQHDSQVQTDLAVICNNATTITNIKVSPKQQSPPALLSTKNLPVSNKNGLLTATRQFNMSSNTAPMPGASSSQQTVPRLSSKTATTVTNKNSTAVASSPKPASPQTVPPTSLSSSTSTSPVSTTTSHDVVDLTEEDEDDNTNRTPPQRITAARQSTSSLTRISTSSPSSTATASPATIVTNSQAPSTSVRPAPTVSNDQLRPLPDHNPCDRNIARPQLNITQENSTVRLTWNLQSTPMESIKNYEIYAYKQNSTLATSDWKKIGTVKSMRLPMAVTLKEFQSNSHYAFAVRAVSINNSIGPFCEPKTIFTGSTSVQPLHTSQLLNVST